MAREQRALHPGRRHRGRKDTTYYERALQNIAVKSPTKQHEETAQQNITRCITAKHYDKKPRRGITVKHYSKTLRQNIAVKYLGETLRQKATSKSRSKSSAAVQSGNFPFRRGGV